MDNAKIQRLPAELFKAWVNLMCIACERGGELPAIDDIAFRLRVPNKRASELRDKMVSLSLIDTEGERFVIHDWDHWQFQSDVSTARVKQFRERKQKQIGNVSVNGVVNGSASVSVSGSVSEVKKDAPKNEEFSDWIERQYGRHPKKGHKVLAQQNAAQKVADGKLDLVLFESRHIAWCKSEEWTWKNGAKAPRLAEWINDDGWLYEPPPAESPNGTMSEAERLYRSDPDKYTEDGYPRRILR